MKCYITVTFNNLTSSLLGSQKQPQRLTFFWESIPPASLPFQEQCALRTGLPTITCSPPPQLKIRYESLPAIGIQQQAIWAAPLAGDVRALGDKTHTGNFVAAIEQSHPTQQAGWESHGELQKSLDPTCSPPPTLTAGAVSHVFLSPEQHSDSSVDDPAIIQKVHTVATPAEQEGCIAPTGPVHSDQHITHSDTTPIAHIEDQLLELFPAAEDNSPGNTARGYVPVGDIPPGESPLGVPPSSSALQGRSPTFTLGSPTSDSGDYFPSGYLNGEDEEQDGVPLLISTFDEQYPKDATPSVPPVIEEHPPTISTNPALGLSISSPVIAISCSPHDNTETHYNEDDTASDPAMLGQDLGGELSSVCSEGLEPLTESDSTCPPACSILVSDSRTAELEGEGEAGDLGFLKECFPDLEATYLEQLYHDCGRDVEAAVSRALCSCSYIHASSDEVMEEMSSNVSTSSLTNEHASQFQAATRDGGNVQDTKTFTRQVLEFWDGDLEGMTFDQLGHEKFNVTEVDVHPDCVDDEEIARQLQQELNLELQSSHASPLGHSPDRSPATPPQPPPEEKRTLPVTEGKAPDSDDNLVLKLTPSLARQLQEMFGSVNELLPFPGECIWHYVDV